MSFITNDNAALYINQLAVVSKKVKFEQEYPYTDRNISSILDSMLEFNPYFRKPASQILNREIFENQHKEHPEFGHAAPNKIILEYDMKNAYDYTDEFKQESPLIDNLKKILAQEIKIIHSEEYKRIVNFDMI